MVSNDSMTGFQQNRNVSYASLCWGRMEFRTV
jgi:hypothetical protein